MNKKSFFLGSLKKILVENSNIEFSEFQKSLIGGF